MTEYLMLKAPPNAQGTLRSSRSGVTQAPSLVVADLDPQSAREARRDPDVSVMAEVLPLKLVRPVAVANAAADPVENAAAWGIHAVRAIDTPFTGAGIVVAVLDTGIDASHPAFSGVELVQRDFTGEGLADVNGHGTHCAGTIFGRDVDGIRIGVAPGVERALIGKVLGEVQGGSTTTLWSAIQWAAEQGAHVISMSLGIDFPGYVKALRDRGMDVEYATSRALQEYTNTLRLFDELTPNVATLAQISNSACMLVAASGNESHREIADDRAIGKSPPANARGILSVGALQRPRGSRPGFTVADFSNAEPDVSAPGVDIISARTGGGLSTMSGTSMATPHVAGIAALWAEKLLQDDGRVRNEPLRARVEGNTTRRGIAASETREDVGSGLVQAPQA